MRNNFRWNLIRKHSACDSILLLPASWLLKCPEPPDNPRKKMSHFTWFPENRCFIRSFIGFSCLSCLHQQRENEANYGGLMEWHWQRKTNLLGEKPVPRCNATRFSESLRDEFKTNSTHSVINRTTLFVKCPSVAMMCKSELTFRLFRENLPMDQSCILFVQYPVKELIYYS